MIEPTFEHIEILFNSYSWALNRREIRFAERIMLGQFFHSLTKEQKEIVENKCNALVTNLKETGFIR